MAFPDGIADFRSDTVTWPTDAMRSAMAAAEVGDDSYGEDPTVNALEADVGTALEVEAALFVPSGTMGNQLAIAVWTERGQDVLCAHRAHLRNAEKGAASAWSGVALRPLGDERGVIRPEEVTAALAEAGEFVPAVGLLAFENTHYFSGGTVLPVDVMEAASARARAAGVPVHLDGARLWNAVAASGVPGPRYAAAADSVMFCFSKGLGAPVGSVLAGSAEFIVAARRLRKRQGGTMRQAGIIAAAARIALAERERLGEDHELARVLAGGIAERFPDAIDLDTVQTNMVMVDESRLPWAPGELVTALAAEGIRVGYVAPGRLRFTTHRNVDEADIKRLLAVVDAS